MQGDEVRTFLARRSIDLVRHFAGWAGVPLDVAASGSLLVARSGGHRKLLAAELAQSLRWGVDLAAISPAEAAARTGGYYHAAGDEDVVWCPEDVYIEEPGALIDAYLAAARRAGVQVLADEPVTAVTSRRGCDHRPGDRRPQHRDRESSWTPRAPGSARSVNWPGPGWQPRRSGTSCW